MRGFPKIKGALLWGPDNTENKDLGSVLGSPLHFAKLPCLDTWKFQASMGVLNHHLTTFAFEKPLVPEASRVSRSGGFVGAQMTRQNVIYMLFPRSSAARFSNRRCPARERGVSQPTCTLMTTWAEEFIGMSTRIAYCILKQLLKKAKFKVGQ